MVRVFTLSYHGGEGRAVSPDAEKMKPGLAADKADRFVVGDLGVDERDSLLPVQLR